MNLLNILIAKPYFVFLMLTHSFVIVAYGESPHLEKCILSLQRQELSSHIFLTTSTPSHFLESIADKYAITYIINTETGGSIGADWNYAVSVANTALVTLAHQDDIYRQDFSKEVIQAYQKFKFKKVSLIFTDYQDLINGQVRASSRNVWVKRLLLIPFLFTGKLESRFLKKLILSLGDPICCPTVTLNKQQHIGFRFDESFTCALDWEGWYRLAQTKGCFAFISKKLVQHRIHEASETSAQLSNGKRSMEEAIMFHKIWGRRMGKFIARIYKLGYKDNQLLS